MLVLESLETSLTFVCPLELDTFVKQIGQRLGNLGEVLDETTTIASEAEETSDLLDSPGRSLVKNSLNTFWVYGNAILGNHMTKVSYLGKPEFTLRILSIEFVFSKLFQYKMKVFNMFFFILGVYQDIIQINHDELVQAKRHDGVIV